VLFFFLCNNFHGHAKEVTGMSQISFSVQDPLPGPQGDHNGGVPLQAATSAVAIHVYFSFTNVFRDYLTCSSHLVSSGRDG
jgi:hypothetical protein